MDLLKLVALDGDDMDVVAAHLQDAIFCASDVHWRPAENRVVIALNRFDWESAQGHAAEFRRRRAALRFERVLGCQCRNVDSASKDRLFNLLTISFTQTDAPSGVVTLTFSGGAALRLQVECLEVELADLGPAWTTECCPDHAVETPAGEQPAAASVPRG
jgi:hypothetical protein